jgi:hypothetical protein
MKIKSFNKYLKDRYYDQIEWYGNAAKKNQSYYIKFQWGLIILSALTPVLITIDLYISIYPILRWIPITTSVFVAIFAAALKTFKFQENWINYRTTCESLKKEKHYYDANLGEYAKLKTKKRTFVERVENLISREHSLWITTSKERK